MPTFELNGELYETDAETLEVLRGIVPDAKASGDGSAVQAVVALGLKTGRVLRAVDVRELAAWSWESGS